MRLVLKISFHSCGALCRKVASLDVLNVTRENKYSNYHDN